MPCMRIASRPFSSVVLLVGLFFLSACSTTSVWDVQTDSSVASSDAALSASAPSSVAAEETRTLLRPQSIEQSHAIYLLPDDVKSGASINGEPPVSTTLYENTDKGLRVSLPYNPAWGTAQYRINPYDESTQAVVFGPLSGCEGGAVCREQRIRFVPAQTADKLLADLRKKREHDLATIGSSELTDPRRKKIGSQTVVEYTVNGLCAYPTVVVIGKKFNYEFSMCGGRTVYFESIVETMQVMD